ncbi:uncharacterized protein [Henckelia pumila]|uniref:uncharacterized protein n=1 Tax=Henckelia pumila TaxID=405737 RepID=UPI003C6E0EA9
MSKKRRLQDNVVVNLTEECSVILRKKMLQKLKDPGSSTISCSIGDAHVKWSFMALELGEIKTSTITLQLDDRSITYPRGIVKILLVKVKKIIFLADFETLDMEDDHDAPSIYKIPFLATTEVKIDVKKEEFSMGVEDEKVVFNVFKEANNASMENVFIIEQSNKMECYRITINAVEWAREEES